MKAFFMTPLLSTLAVALDILPSHTIYQFSKNPTWIENLAVRKNGNLLLTLNTSPDIVQLAKPWSSSPTPSLLHRFDSLDAVLGIAETTPDTFVVVGGNFSGLAVSIPGTFSAWEVRLEGAGNGTEVEINKIVDIPEANFLNGVATLPWNRNVVFVAESFDGKLYRVNVREKTYEVVLQGEDLEPVPDSDFPFGINGVKIRGKSLYWSNSSKRKIYSVKIDKSGSIAAKATHELFGSLPSAAFIDDFTFDNKGGIYAVTNLDDKLVYLNGKGNSTVVVGSDTELTVAGGTADAFGRTKKDKHVLYVVTGGANAVPVNGTVTEPGKVVAVDTRN